MNMNTLQRTAALCAAVVAALLASSCEKHLDMPTGRWVLTEHSGANGNAMVLEFADNDLLYVYDANEDVPPFYEADEWMQWLDNDSVLNISYIYTAYDGEDYYSATQLYRLPLSFSDGGRTLTLQYEEPRFLQANLMHTYTFVRR